MPKITLDLTDDEMLALRRIIYRELHPPKPSQTKKELASMVMNQVLDDYYARIDRGERVKLVVLARKANVSYDSLRQLKIRRDKERS